MGKFSRLGNALYEGDVSIDFVGRKWLWYSISGVIVLLAVGGLYFKGLNLGIEFEGRQRVQRVRCAPARPPRTTSTRSATRSPATGIKDAASPIVNTSGADSIRVQTEVADYGPVRRPSCEAIAKTRSTSIPRTRSPRTPVGPS